MGDTPPLAGAGDLAAGLVGFAPELEGGAHNWPQVEKWRASQTASTDTDSTLCRVLAGIKRKSPVFSVTSPPGSNRSTASPRASNTHSGFFWSYQSPSTGLAVGDDLFQSDAGQVEEGAKSLRLPRRRIHEICDDGRHGSIF